MSNFNAQNFFENTQIFHNETSIQLFFKRGNSDVISRIDNVIDIYKGMKMITPLQKDKNE